MTDTALKLVDSGDQLAAELDSFQSPPDYARPAVNDLTKRASELSESIAVGKESIDQQIADLRQFDHDYLARRKEMVDRLEAEKAVLAQMIETRTGLHAILAQAAALQKPVAATPKAPKVQPVKAPRRSRSKKNAREAAE